MEGNTVIWAEYSILQAKTPFHWSIRLTFLDRPDYSRIRTSRALNMRKGHWKGQSEGS